MQSEGFGIEIIPYASHLDCVLGVTLTSVSVRRSKEGYWIVSFLNDQHSYYFFIAVYDKISAELVGILIYFY